MAKKVLLCLFTYFIFLFGVKAYTSYNQGDVVSYNGMDFYVLYDSDSSSNVLTLLKKEPLTVSEVEKYGVGHINRFTSSNQNQVININGYGSVVYYSSALCGIVNGSFNGNLFVDCKSDYVSSEVKYIVDSWGEDNFNINDVWKDELGYNYRLITKEEILEYFNYTLYNESLRGYGYRPVTDTNQEWFYNNNYAYWTMTEIDKVNNGGNLNGVMYIANDGSFQIEYGGIYDVPHTIRPVVLLRKKALEKKEISPGNNSETNSNNKENVNSNSSTRNIKSNFDTTRKNNVVVSVPDTFTKASILSITLGIILVGTCTTIYIYIIKRGKNEKDS